MTPRVLGPSRTTLVVRGIATAAVLVTAATAAVAYGGGLFDRAPQVYADIPASAGLLIGEIGVQYHGVQVGKVVDIDSTVDRSRVTMRIDDDGVPASVVVRVVPRTLFGDVYLQLVNPDPTRTGDLLDGDLLDGDVVAMDGSADAVQLSGVYRQVTDLLNSVKPAEAQAALTAVSTALRGRGERLGATIDHLASATAALEPQTHTLLDHTPETAQVLDAVAAATPDVLATIEAATSLSRTMLDRSSGASALLRSAAGLGSTAAALGRDNLPATITVVERGSTVLRTVSENAEGLGSTLEQLAPFGAAGARIFATGRFDITAVPDFSSPLPYTAADCPRYPGLSGPNCALAEIQDTATGTPQPLNPASTMLLAPVLRGTEVTIE